MKWILCGKNDVAIASLEYLVERGDDVWVLPVAGDDGEAGWQGSLRAAAKRLGVAFEQPRNINAPEFIDRLAAYGARALISIQYDQILRGPLFRGIGCPCLNLHYSLLPRHRGVYPVAWALLEGDDEAGVTLHHMVEKIDAGDLIAQKRVPIGPTDVAREVYDRQAEAAVALFRESHPFSDELLATRLAQDASGACYHSFGDLDYSDLRIDWARPALELQRWIRAMVFPPLNHPETSHGGRRLFVARLAADTGSTTAAPGEILVCNEDGVEVATGDGSLRITEIHDADAPERDALADLVPGERLA